MIVTKERLSLSHEDGWDGLSFLSRISVGVGEDAPRTERCSNRCCLQILFIFLSGKNPETAYAFEASFPSENFRANAAAFPQSVRPLR
ncbi:hypothetical protein J2T20_000638 [Paenibacillus wynnii]|nr:hypothetical protein [Paenibacillus wynnii]